MIGLPDIDELNISEPNLIILDDLMTECSKDNSIKDLFTIDSNHKNVSVFLLTQNLFLSGKHTRTISLNCNYIIVLNNPRDRSQFSFLSRQMFPNNTKFLNECFYDAVENKNYGYLLLDFTQSINKIFRIQTDICFETLKRVFYTPKENN